MPGFHHWTLFGWLPLLQCVDLDLCLYCVAIQYLVYRCGNVPQTTAEISNTPRIHCAQHVQQSIDMSIQLPAGLQCHPFKWLKLFNRSGAWLYPRVNVANTFHLSKNHSYCLQNQNRGCKDRPPERHLITVTNEMLKLQPLSMHILYPGTNEHSA